MMFASHQSTERFICHCLMLGLAAGFVLISISAASVESAQQGVATVSAASFEPLVAPDSIATAFGSRLATQTVLATPGQPLPVSLGGTTVEINQRAALLFYVTPTQIAFLVPPETEIGAANVSVRAGDGTVSTGTVRVAAVAPGFFTADGNGRGIPAANLLRVKPNGQQTNEVLFVRDALTGNLVTVKANPGPEGERLFLILFLTGLRGAPDADRNGNSDESVRVTVGGVESPPLYAGRQGGFAGLDQLNIELPRNLTGRGRLDIFVKVTNAVGVTSSNTVQIEMAATAADSTPPTASSGSRGLQEDSSRSFELEGSGGGQALQFVLTGLPVNGQLSGTPPNVNYTPKRDFNGNDPFTFRVRTETAFSEEQTITMIVQPVNDPPTLIVPGAQVVNLGERLSFLISAINPDAGEQLSFSLIDDAGKPPGATITREPGDTSARFNWTPPAESVGKTYIARFRVKDNTAEELSDTKTVTITTGTLWAKTSGPEGGTVNSLATAGANLFAGTFSGGVFRSSDQGNTWTAANNGLGELSVNAVFAVGSSLLAGTSGGGIYLSPDQGQNWMATNIRDLRVFEFAANGNTLFAATDSLVRRSTDGGRTWTGTNLNLFDVEVVRTVLAKNGRVFAGTQDTFEAGLFVTSNDGQSWTPVRGGLPNNGQIGVTSLAATPTHVFALTGDFFSTAVYASADNGQSWTFAGTGLPNNVRKLSANGATAYAMADNRIFASTDGGGSWSQLNAVFTTRGVRTLGFTANRLLAGTGGDGVFASTDAGQNFAEANQGFTNSGVAAFGLHDDQRQLFVATSRNVVVTANIGTSYQIANRALPLSVVNGQPAELSIRALAATGTQLFAATQGGVFRSLGRDAGWQAVNNGLANLNISSLVLAGSRLFAGTGAGVFVSANQGQSWTAVNGGLTNLSVTALVLNGTQLLAGTGDGVFAFNDATQNWSRVGTLSFSVRVLAAAGRFIVAAGGTGIKVTEDGGGKWRDVIEGLPQSPTALAIRGTTAYGGISLGGFGDGIFALSAGAEQWRAVNDTLTNLAVNALIVNGDHLFAGTNDGVSLSTNTDQSWKNSGRELATLDINALWQQASGTGTDLFAAANNGSVFRSGDLGQSWQRTSLLSPESANVTALQGAGGALLAGTGGTGAFRSFDLGGNWAVANAGLNNQQVRALVGGTFVFAATAGGVYRSGNQGQSWERTSGGLPTLLISSLLSASDALWAGTDDRGVFLSRDQGQSWQEAAAALNKFGIRSLGAYQSLLFAGTYRDGLYRSLNNGQSWLLAETDLPGVSSFAASGNKLYAGGVYGVYVSTDQGRSWRQINAGLTKTGVNSLTVIGDKLYAATSNGGVFVSQIPE